jgi:hypothetical protein
MKWFCFLLGKHSAIDLLLFLSTSALTYLLADERHGECGGGPEKGNLAESNNPGNSLSGKVRKPENVSAFGRERSLSLSLVSPRRC